MERNKIFYKRLHDNKILVAPGAYDAFSAKLIEHMGFEVIYITGAGVSASMLGAPDIGLITMTEQLQQARYIVNAVKIPIICDADTGYGNPISVMRTVKEFEKAGVSAIHLEDQEIPKKCGHLEGKRLVSKEEMVQKIRAAVQARESKHFIIIARTDARSVNGLNDALERGHAYMRAGADGLFVEAPESLDELKMIGSVFSGVPLLLNCGGKKTPSLSVSKAEKLGFSIIIFPGDLQRAAGMAMLNALRVLKNEGTNQSFQKNILSFDERFEILGLRKYLEQERSFLDVSIKR